MRRFVRLLRRLASPVGRWVDEPADPRRLAVWRIAGHGWMVVYLARRWKLVRRVAGGRRHEWRPVGVARALPAPAPVPAVRAVTAATTAAGVLATAGVAHPLTGPAHAGLALVTLSYRNSWGMVFHNDNLAVLHLLTLAAAPAGDAWSFDALRRGGDVPAPDARYGWPLQLANAVTAAQYLVCGIAKLRSEHGLGWATGAVLRDQVAVDGIRKGLLRPSHDDATKPLLDLVDGHPWLWNVFAATALAVELGAPLALLDRRIGRLWSAAAWSMHVGIRALMRITFRHQLSSVPYVPLWLRPGPT